MALITWNDNLSVNVAEIDRQHQKLITQINDLNSAMKEGKGKEVLGKIINELSSYAAIHFSTEEKYFDRYGYPQATAHEAEHDAFVQKVLEFKEGFEAGRLSISIQVMNFLSDWLRDHIKKADKEYSQFFNQHGLK